MREQKTGCTFGARDDTRSAKNAPDLRKWVWAILGSTCDFCRVKSRPASLELLVPLRFAQVDPVTHLSVDVRS